MNDDELPTSAEQASAYLDGELDAGDRATAAADPDTMALLDSFARIRAVLGEIGPVDGSTRTAAMAAALAEFDLLHGAPSMTADVAPASATVTSLLSHRRMRAYRLITGVAAAAIVVVVGVVALNASRGNDKSSSSATEATVTDAAAGLPAVKAADTAAAPAATAAPAVAAGSATRDSAEPPEIDNAEALAAYVSGLEAADSAALPSPSTTTLAPLAVSGRPPIAGVYGVPPCLASNETVLAIISFHGTPAFAIRDATDGSLRAIDVFDCHVVIPAAP